MIGSPAEAPSAGAAIAPTVGEAFSLDTSVVSMTGTTGVSSSRLGSFKFLFVDGYGLHRDDESERPSSHKASRRP